jgi:K+/H+ antiporter YhaU regulatory subunit KhtT
LSNPFLSLAPSPEGAPTGAPIARYDLGNLDGVRIVVVVHPDGQRDLHLLTTEDNEPVARFEFTEEQARHLARALDGGPRE